MRRSLCAILLAIVLPTWVSAQCGATFTDGFESGSYTPTWSIGSGLTSGAVTMTNPSSGLYRLEGYGGTSTHLTGFSTVIPTTTPSFISWDVYPTGTGAANYMVLGNSSVTATNCVAFCYWQGGTNLRFVSGSTAVYNCTPGQWYHIEMRNINWSLHTFDIYINNTQVATNFPFRSATQNDLTNLHLYNFNSATGVWDNIVVGTGNSPIATAAFSNVTCNGDSNATIDVSVTGGTPGYSYLWSTGDTVQDLSALGPGSYTVTVTDIVPCSSTTSVTITEPTPLVISTSVNGLSCYGSADGAIDQTPSGGTPGYNYLWSNGATTQDLSGLAAGPYTIMLTDSNGCTAADTVDVTQPSQIIIGDSITMPSCMGDSNGAAIAVPTGGAGTYSYFWSTGSTTSSSGAVAAGDYIVMVTDITGCSQADTITVAEPALLTVTGVPSDPLCADDSTGTIDITPAGGTAAYSYIWSNGTSLDDPTGLAAGSYSVTITDANGCVATGSFSLTNPTVVTATGVSGDDTGTSNGSIDLTVAGGAGGYTYLWSNGATTEDVSGLAAGNYTVTITDANGCMLVETFTVDLVIGVSNAFPIGVSIAPNPFATAFTVQLSGMGSQVVALALVDVQGRVLWQQTDVTASQVLVEPVLAAGIYFLQVRIGDQAKMVKVMRQ
jgi:hypothetical protein